MTILQKSDSGPRLQTPRFAHYILLGLLFVISPILSASPASAHGLGGPQPTNVEVSTRGTEPKIADVSIRLINLGYLVELKNSGPNAIVVIGYDREPYLRIGPSGVEVNRRSPATFINRSATPSASLPDGLDARATPIWESISRVPTARWHDHRAHWMGRGAVHNAEWSIPLIVTDRDTRSERQASILGTLNSVAPPSTLTWGLIAAVSAIILGALGLTRRWVGVLICALSVIAVSELIHIYGSWGAWRAPIPTRLLGVAPSVLAITFSVIALVVLIARRSTRPDSATPLALIAGIFTAIAGGLADLNTLARALVPTTLSFPIARLTVALAIGGGVGVALIAGSHLKPVKEGLKDENTSGHHQDNHSQSVEG